MNIIVQWTRRIAGSETETRLRMVCRWYEMACYELRLSAAISAICVWLIRMHTFSAILILGVVPFYYLADFDLAFSHICTALCLYLLMMLCCAILRKVYAPVPVTGR
ncbi:MAG: hypothetical protein HRU15_13515 [Planctomycetes bacterium]|nr:hypothetical protein [Planctomycetota bacterium]